MIHTKWIKIRRPISPSLDSSDLQKCPTQKRNDRFTRMRGHKKMCPFIRLITRFARWNYMFRRIQLMKNGTRAYTDGWLGAAHSRPKDTIPTCTPLTTIGPPLSPAHDDAPPRRNPAQTMSRVILTTPWYARRQSALIQIGFATARRRSDNVPLIPVAVNPHPVVMASCP